MNFYKHHLGDYSRCTSHISMLEDGAYRRLLDVYYTREAPLPADIKAVCRLARAQTRQDREAVEIVLREFFDLRDDGWHNARADEEIQAAQEKAERNREVGKKGGRPPKTETQTVQKGNPEKTQMVKSGNPKETLASNHKPVTSNQDGVQPASTALTAVGARASPGDLSGEMRKAGIQSNPSDPRIIALSERGVTRENIAAACNEAKTAKPGERINPGYVIAIADRWAMEAERISSVGGQTPSARASPKRKTAAEERAEVSTILTGRKGNDGQDGGSGGRDITGEAVQVA